MIYVGAGRGVVAFPGPRFLKIGGLMTDQALTPDQAAKVIGVAKATLARWRMIGTGPKFLKAGKKVIYRERDIARWIEQNTFDPRSALKRTG